MEKKTRSLYSKSSIVAFFVVAVVAILTVTTGHTGEHGDREPLADDSLNTGQKPVDTLVETQDDAEIDSSALQGADDPLSNALRTRRPVLADFGRGTCIPCRMMQPILEKLQKEYAGKAEILILDVGEYAALAKECHIMIIPTQIFFDSTGQEVSRHQGFMAEEDIVAQLKLMGLE
jgi:thioredoxin 1